MTKGNYPKDPVDESVDENVLELLKGENTWNHRVIKTTSEYGYYYAIHEVHYTNDIPHSLTVDPISVGGEDVESIKWTLEKMLIATEKEVIPMEYFDKFTTTPEYEELLDQIAEDQEAKEETHSYNGPDLGGC